MQYGPDFAAAYSHHWRQWGVRQRMPFMAAVCGRAGGTWLDVACGTGETAAFAQQHGFTVTGVDVSRHPLRHAKINAPGGRFIEADARTLALDQKFDVVSLLGGSTNYFLTRRDLMGALRAMKRHMTADGVMLLDVNLPPAFADIAGQTLAMPDAQRPLMVTVDYKPVRRRAELIALGFVPRGKLWRRFTETHDLRAWQTDEIEPLLANLGLHFDRHDLDTQGEADAETRRMLYRCQRD